MSAHGMKPSFKDWTGYQKWLSEWRIVYMHVADTCRKRKLAIKDAKKRLDFPSVKALHAKYVHERVMATKMITLRNEAVIRWKNIKTMLSGLKQQNTLFPLDIPDARNIDFHFNKKHLEFPQIPMWAIKAKGKTFYVNHLDCNIPWTTKERPDDTSTKGMIRIKRGNIHIDCFGNATIS